MNKASAFRIKQADGTYGDPIVFGLDKSEVQSKFVPGDYNMPAGNAKGTDCTETIQNLIDTVNYVKFRPKQTYYFKNSIVLKQGTTFDLNGALLIYLPDKLATNTTTGSDYSIYGPWKVAFSNFPLRSNVTATGYNGGNGDITFKNGTIWGASFALAHGEHITFQNVRFHKCLRNHFFEIAACRYMRFLNCHFNSVANTGACEYINLDLTNPPTETSLQFPYFHSTVFGDSEVSPGYDNNGNSFILVDGCQFVNNETTGPDGVTVGATGAMISEFGFDDAIGYHSSVNWSARHSNIIVRNCTINGASDVAFRMRHMTNVCLLNNIITYAHRLAYIDNSKNVTITGNVVIDDTNGYARSVTYQDSSSFTNKQATNVVIDGNAWVGHADYYCFTEPLFGSPTVSLPSGMTASNFYWHQENNIISLTGTISVSSNKTLAQTGTLIATMPARQPVTDWYSTCQVINSTAGTNKIITIKIASNGNISLLPPYKTDFVIEAGSTIYISTTYIRKMNATA